MDNKTLEKKLKKLKGLELVSRFIHGNKKYIKACKTTSNSIKYFYYEIVKENEIKDIEDHQLLEYFKNTYEYNLNNIIY